MSVVAGTGIITPALTLIQVVSQGQTPASEELLDGLLLLNSMFANWNADELTAPVTSVSGTWGSGIASDFLGVTSVAFSGYTGPAPARLIDAFVTPNSRDIRIQIVNLEYYRGIGNKAATSAVGPELMAYDPGVGDSGSGATVFVYPVPSVNMPTRVIFRYPFQIPASPAASITLSAMATQAAIYNLAVNYANAFGANCTADIRKEAADSLARLRNFNASAYNQNPNPPQGQTLPAPAQPTP